MEVLIAIVSSVAVVGPAALVAGGYLGYKYGRKVEAKAQAVIAKAASVAAVVKG